MDKQIVYVPAYGIHKGPDFLEMLLYHTLMNNFKHISFQNHKFVEIC